VTKYKEEPVTSLNNMHTFKERNICVFYMATDLLVLFSRSHPILVSSILS